MNFAKELLTIPKKFSIDFVCFGENMALIRPCPWVINISFCDNIYTANISPKNIFITVENKLLVTVNMDCSALVPSTIEKFLKKLAILL